MHNVLIPTEALLPDDIMTKIVTSKLDHLRNKVRFIDPFCFLSHTSFQHWILDGFPRTIGQAKLLDAHLRKSATPITLIINLDIPDDVILSRISGGWILYVCINLQLTIPKIVGSICHQDGFITRVITAQRLQELMT